MDNKDTDQIDFGLYCKFAYDPKAHFGNRSQIVSNSMLANKEDCSQVIYIDTQRTYDVITIALELSVITF